ncbi:GWT1-domain-containing protein [Lipomyces tetrasporus]|uniref:GPI-anchored wall transfer protein n=1 Tax=Lipomyces tetrasporus TaxID=54092 RepID=A0AAD7QQX0_9ASCO|nr:GWT1-domain-containing protein [Lipomyces tetrasporus]KAJ8099616.1 GWT1-domain-containing protein [Lipomyces tetrasporus]
MSSTTPPSLEIAADKSAFKHLKEEFVSGLTGGSIQEINIVTLVALSSYAVWCTLQTRFSFFSIPQGSKVPSLSSLLVDFLLNWVALTLSITIYASHPFAFNLLILAPVAIVYVSLPSIVATRQRTAQAVLKRRDRKIRVSAHDLNSLSTPSQYAGSLVNNDYVSATFTEPASTHNSNHENVANLGSCYDSSSPYSCTTTHDQSHPLASSASSSSTSISSMSVDAYLPKKSFLTTYRAGMMIITCIAILAVDFRIFPRRFAKVETWGTSLMDLGVGSFVFSMGLVSARGPLKEMFLKQQPDLWASLKRSIGQTTSVLLLGLLRLLLVKAVDYHEHISEYGVHWNFFMTLGFLPPFVTLFNFVSNYTSPAAMSLGVGVVYQALLTYTPLTRFILTAPRTGIVSMNKEGIFSFIGYLSIFLAGQTTGFYTLPTTPRHIPYVSRLLGSGSSGPLAASRKTMLTYLLVAGIGHVGLFLICTKGLNMPVSRRLANLPYVLWVTSINIMYILLYLLVEVIFYPSSDHAPESKYEDAVPWGLEAVNDNGLAVFLLANLLTGAVNLSVNTLDVKNVQAITLLVIYAALLATAAGIMKRNGWRVRV